jgi:hypothetical protein
MYTTNYLDLAGYHSNKIITNVSNYFDILNSRKSKEIQLGILGAYHGLNLGDMALAKSIQRIAEKKHISSQIKSLTNYLKYGDTRSIIFGGGAIATPDNLKKLMLLSKGSAANVALIGVDLGSNFSDEILEFLKGCKFLSSRFQFKSDDQINLQKALGRNDIVFHPDLAFSLYSEVLKSDPQSMENRPKILGINIIPWYFSLKGGTWIGKDFSKSYFGRSDIRQENYKYLGIEYVKLIQDTIDFYQKLGYTVHHIPFALEDDLFARSVLDKSQVFFHKYTQNPNTVLKEISNFSLFIATRFHAHIFALIQKIPLISIAYGMKCQNLFDSIGIPANNQINHQSFLDNKNKCLEFLLDIDPVILSDQKLHQISNNVIVPVARAIDLLV